MAVWNAMALPSGDHRGLESGPGCVTSARTLTSETRTTEMSAVSELARFGSRRWSNAIDAPSGDQSKLPIVNAPLVSRCPLPGSACATSITCRCVIR